MPILEFKDRNRGIFDFSADGTDSGLQGVYLTANSSLNFRIDNGLNTSSSVILAATPSLEDGGWHLVALTMTPGVASDGFPFVRGRAAIERSAPALRAGATRFYVARLCVREDRQVELRLRIFEGGESLSEREPTAWTVVSAPLRSAVDLAQVRLSVGEDAVVDVDELRIGTTWSAVTAAQKGD